MEFEKVVEITKKTIKEFENAEQKPWGAEGTTIELAKQVGELSKHIMVFEKYYIQQRDNDPKYKTTKDNIADELSDILFCVIRLSEHYKINLEEKHIEEMRKALKSLGKEADF